ncbi:MAG TPA: hypothetical protein VGG29_20890 [Caulobacteraceae bacterium]|jgi:hypothetical protein
MKLGAALQRARRRAQPWLAAHGRDAGRDLAGVAGAGAIAFGFHLAWPPLGWIVLGLELVAFTVLTRPRPAPPKTPTGGKPG